MEEHVAGVRREACGARDEHEGELHVRPAAVVTQQRPQPAQARHVVWRPRQGLPRRAPLAARGATGARAGGAGGRARAGAAGAGAQALCRSVREEASATFL